LDYYLPPRSTTNMFLVLNFPNLAIVVGLKIEKKMQIQKKM